MVHISLCSFVYFHILHDGICYGHSTPLGDFPLSHFFCFHLLRFSALVLSLSLCASVIILYLFYPLSSLKMPHLHEKISLFFLFPLFFALFLFLLQFLRNYTNLAQLLFSHILIPRRNHSFVLAAVVFACDFPPFWILCDLNFLRGATLLRWVNIF